MKHLICTLVLLHSFFGIISAQSTLPKAEADSLWTIWTDPDQHDTVRLNAISDFAWNGYLFSQPDSAFYYAQLQYNFAQSKNLKEEMAIALNTQGVSWATRSMYPEALDCYKRSLKIMEESGVNKARIKGPLNNIGLIYKVQGNYPEALEYFERTLLIPFELGNKNASAAALNNVGMIYKIQGDLPKALDYFLRGLKLNEEIGNKSLFGISLLNVGSVYFSEGEYNQALDYLTQALNLFEEIGDENRAAIALNSIGGTYENLGDFELALEYRERSLRIREKIGDKEGMAYSLNGIGNFYTSNGDYSQALEYFKRSLELREQIGDKNATAGSLRSIGVLYNLQKENNSAIEWCEKGRELSNEIGDIAEQQATCECLYVAYKELGIPDKALQYYEQMIVFRDSLYNEENTKKIARLEMQYEIDKKEAAIRAEEKRLEEERARRNILQYSISFIIILIIFGIVLGLGYIRVSQKIAEALILFSILILFEFCLMFLDPFKSRLTGNQPIYILLFNAFIALVLVPVHIFFENRMKKKIIKK